MIYSDVIAPLSARPLITRTAAEKDRLRKYAKDQGLPVRIYESFTAFAHYMVPLIKMNGEEFEWQWFHYYICEMFDEVIFKGTKLFTIELPPQVGKSLLTSLFIVYCHGINPDLSIMYVTYNETKAVDFTKKYVIHQMGTDKYAKIFPFVVTKNMLDKKDQSKKGSFQRKTATFSDNAYSLSCPIESVKLNYRGGYKCFGIEQGIHGSPADIFLMDDYVDKGDSVRSENFRLQRREWFFNDMASRLQGNNSVVGGICTRWYYDDIIGLLQGTYLTNVIPQFEKYGRIPPTLRQIRVRTEFRKSDDNPDCDPRTEDGQILWEEHLLKLSFSIEGMYYNAVYNCDPSDTNSTQQLKESDFGQYYTLPGETGRYYFMIDGASTTNKRSDSTAIGLWYVTISGGRYLVKLWYVKKEIPELIKFVDDLLTEYDYYDVCLIEYANSGVSLYQFLGKIHHNVIALGFSGRPIDSASKVTKSNVISKGNSKTDRFYRILPEFSDPGKPKVFLPAEPIEHQKEFVRQVITFDGTAGRKDDFVDVLSYLVYYTKKTTIRATSSSKINQKSLHVNNGLCYNSANDGFHYR